MVDVGFVGVGGIAQSHLKNLAQMEDVRIAAMSDVDSRRVAETAAAYGAQGYADAEAMLDGVHLDAVYICVPPFAHGAPERAVIARRIPLYVEKPLSVKADLPEKIAREIDEKGLIAAVGFQLRYLDSIQTLRSELTGRRLGMVRGHYACPLVQTPWWRKQEFSGGQLLEQVIHVVDLIRYTLQDEIVRVYSQAATRIHTDVPDLDIADVTATAFTFRSGAVGALSNTCALPSGWQVGMDVVAQNLSASWNRNSLQFTDAAGTRHVESKEMDAMAAADRAFIQAVASGSGEGILPTYSDAVKTHRVVMAALRSAETGMPVEVTPGA